MRTTARWATRRRTQYMTALTVFFMMVFSGVYMFYFYEPGNCFDNWQNGNERGIDCGGGCTRICLADVFPPREVWSESFEIFPGQYNAVAYIENRNLTAASPEMRYTFTLRDEAGVITERSGVTVLPPDSVYPIFEGRIQTGDRIPTRTDIEIDAGSIWLPATVSAKQFELVGRNLSDTDTASPRLDAQIRNDSLVSARNVEVVATIFNSAGIPLTASQTIVPRFDVGEVEPVIFTWPQPIAKTIRSCEVPTDVVIGIDLSGSMNDDGGTPPQPISSVLSAASSFSSRLKDKDQAAVVTYATEAEVTLPFINDSIGVSKHIIDLDIAPAEEVGSTNTGDAIKRAGEELGSTRHNQNARKVFVLMTDGLANAPDEDPEAYALEQAEFLKKTGTQVFTVGLGEKLNEPFLQQLASSPQHYFHAPSTAQLGGIYESITEAICEDGAAIIEIIPKTDASFESLR